MTLPNIDIAINCTDWPKETELQALVQTAMRATKDAAKLQWADGAELSVVFTDDEEMQRINSQWRDKNKPTNVLSFPAEDISAGQAAGIMIGDIIFAFQTVHQEAIELDKKFENHLTHLIVHGLLHLFGYDHLTDEQAEEMEELEIKTLAMLEISNPYQNID